MSARVIRFHPDARQELRAAVQFYEGEAAGLGRELVHEVRVALDRIAEWPASGASDAGGIRRVVLARFPFTVVYQTLDGVLVDGVTKLGRMQLSSATEQQVENYRKMLLSMAEDARVILVKLADRLHNMRTLEHLPPDKRWRIAQETRDIYAPLAHRLGMAAIRWELEDLAFKFLEPEASSWPCGGS